VALPKVSFALIAGSLLAAAAPSVASAQKQNITIDGRFSPAQTLTGPNYSIGAYLGKQVGGNLFHSFGKFGLATGESATFSGPATVNNVIGRVTGGARSDIDGKIQSNIAGANLFLINPGGIVFGPNATVNVSGAFHASTADYIKMADGAKFQATHPDGSTLSAAPPAAFGFLTASPPAISVSGSQLNVSPGQTFGLVGGPVSIAPSPTSITGARLAAPAGLIHVTSAAGTGEVPVDPRNISAMTVSKFGAVEIKGGSSPSILTASSPSGSHAGGSVFVRSDTLTIDAGILAANNSGSGPGGQLVLQADSKITLINKAQVQALALGNGTGANVTISTGQSGTISADAATVQVGSVGEGNGGTLTVNAGQLVLTNGAGFTSHSQGGGNGGDIAITAGSVLLDINPPVDPNTGLFAPTGVVSDTSGAGHGGSITLAAGELTLHNGAAVLAQSSGLGNGGAVSVSVGGALIVDSGASLGTAAYRAGNAGNVVVTATGPIGIDMTVGILPSVLGGIGSQTVGAGDAGNVSVTAGELTITNNGVIVSPTGAAGNSGAISVNVSGALAISNLSGDPKIPTGILAAIGSDSSGSAGNISVSAGTLSIYNGQISSAELGSGKNAGNISVNAGTLSIYNGQISSSSCNGSSCGSGNAGSISLWGDSQLTLGGNSVVQASTGNGNGGSVSLHSPTLTVDDSTIVVNTLGSGIGGSISLRGENQISLNRAIIQAVALSSGSSGGISISTAPGGAVSADFSMVHTGNTETGSGKTGPLSIETGQLILKNGTQVANVVLGSGNAAPVTVTAGSMLIDGRENRTFATAIGSRSGNRGGPPGVVNGADVSITVGPGGLTILANGEIASTTWGPGNAGSLFVNALGGISIDGTAASALTGVISVANPGSSGRAGRLSVTAGSLAIANGATVQASTAGSGPAGDVTVSVAGDLTITGGARAPVSTDISSVFNTFKTGVISSSTVGSGNGGGVSVSAGRLVLSRDGTIATDTFGTGSGNAGTVSVDVIGELIIDGSGQNVFTGISSKSSVGSNGDAGRVQIDAGNLSMRDGGAVSTSTEGSGAGGTIAIEVAGDVALSRRALITSATTAAGNGGTIKLLAEGALTLTDPGTGIAASGSSTAGGNAGSVIVSAPQVAITTGAEIASTMAGTGNGGTVDVTATEALVLDGAGDPNTRIAASAIGTQSGPGGAVTVTADSLTVKGGAQIASTTAGPGKGGDVAVIIANGATLSGAGTAITTSAEQGSSGRGGEVVLTAGGALALSGGARMASTTAGSGNGGTVRVTTSGPLTLTDSGTGILASAASTAGGDAGSVTVAAPQITVKSGAEIASTTAGTGRGGPVHVTATEALVLDGAGDPNTRIAASAIGTQSGAGGAVTVAADTLTVKGGAQIASTTAGPGKGGDVAVTVASDILLSDPGPQITAQSSGSGNAGSITVSAVRLLMDDRAAISTAAEKADGGNIRLDVRDLLYLTNSKITTSVNTENGNGGNITIDPQLVVLNHSSIIAQAAEGRGGNIRINAGAFIQSADSSVDASSEKGISGTVVITGPRVDVNGALVVLSSELRGRAAVLREACAAYGDRPVSSLVEAGRGGLPQDPETTLPALYIADRELSPNPAAGDKTEANSAPLQTTVRLTMHCG
jgi:filamentous hemagglutinin family protein